MIQPIHLIDLIYAVEVPDNAEKFIIDMGYLIFKVPNYANWCNDSIMADPARLIKYVETHKAENDYKTGGMPLPGNWQFICTSKECSEEQAKNIVEDGEAGYKGYNTLEDNVLFWREAIDSLNSLLQSKGCDVNNNYAILKKQ